MKNYNTPYTYKQLNSSILCSEPLYQRPVDFTRVKKIASEFNPSLVNPIKVSKRDDRYYIFDGQHTLAALKMKNNNRDLNVECKVYTDLTLEDEAKLFSEQNGISSKVRINSKMKALYVAGDAKITEMRRLIMSQGIKFDFSNANGPYKIVACAAIYRIYNNTTSSDFKEILSIICGAWGGVSESFSKEILGGMYIFYTTFKKQIYKDKAISQFANVSPQLIVREGKVSNQGGDKRFARQLVIAYNKKLRGGRLPEDF